jgi:hypothetical protein
MRLAVAVTTLTWVALAASCSSDPTPTSLESDCANVGCAPPPAPGAKCTARCGCCGSPLELDAATNDAHDADGATQGTLPDPPFVPFTHARGNGLATGLVTGRIYDDLANPGHTADRMADLAALGVRILRIEIENTTPLSTYKAIFDAARANGIEVMALVSLNSVPGSPSPLAGTRTTFDTQYVPAYIAEIDAVTAALPGLKYVEVWNEPDNFGFGPIATNGGTCVPQEGAFRFALLAVRVFETMNERRKKQTPTPTLAAFDISISHDVCTRQSLFDAQPIASHRAAYRAANGLPDGLPTDIVSIHGYGLTGKAPSETGYTFQGGTFADGVSEFLAAKFADGASAIGSAPVWYSEVGYDTQQLGGADPLARQRDALTFAFATLRAHPEVTAAFWYSYRDDEVGGTEKNGLRSSSVAAFAAHPSYAAYQAQAVLAGDRVAPGGALMPLSAGSFAPGTAIEVRGWAIDADGKAPTIDLAIDGRVVATLTDGTTPIATACLAASSTRCPSVGFSSTMTAPATAGTHELAARATDSTGHARIIGRISFGVAP